MCKPPKIQHAAAKAAGKRKFVVSGPKLLTPSLELKTVFMFKRITGELGKLLPPVLDKRDCERARETAGLHEERVCRFSCGEQ